MQFESPEEALEHIKPLVPDMHLAKLALSKGIGADCPDWVVDGILYLLSNTLMLENIKNKVLSKYDNHWIPDTIPYSTDLNDEYLSVN